jgi:site-specific recombinase XerD
MPSTPQSKQAAPVHLVPTKPSTGIEQAALAFRISRQAQACTKATLIWYDKYVPPLVRFLEEHGVHDPAQATPDLLRRYIVFLQTKSLAPRTVHHHASVARALFHFLTEDGIISANPMAKVKMPRLPKEILPAFAPVDVSKILAACLNFRDRAIVLALLDSGARASEFIALDVGDLDLKTGTLMIRLGKGQKDRSTYLGAQARKAVLKYLMERGSPRKDEPLWLSQRGDRLGTWGLRQLLDRLATRSGVDHCHPHTFRRTFALWSLRAGMNIFALQQIMGHSDLTVLQKYLALVTQDLQAAHEKYGAVDNMLPHRAR